MTKSALQTEIKDKKRGLRQEKIKNSNPVLAVKNGVRLVEVVALGCTGGFTLYKNWAHQTVSQDIFLFAGLVIALRASYEFYRYLTNRDA